MSTSSPKSNLDLPVQYVKGIGPRRSAVLARHGIKCVRDLLYYFPFDYIDLNTVEPIRNLRRYIDSGRWVTVIGTVRTFDLLGRPPRQRFVLVLGDESGTVQLVFFRSIQFFKKAFTIGELLAVSGKVTQFASRPQIIHPSIDRLGEGDEEAGEGNRQFLHTKGIVPKYGSSGELRDVNLHVKGLRRIIRSAVENFVNEVPEILPDDLRSRNRLPQITEALQNIHFPKSSEHLDKARRRLKFDEFFTMQVLLALRRASVKVETPGIAFDVESKLARRLVDSLPFELTSAQKKVIREITDDMKLPRPMNRLLQGDVGSGKTIVALVAMLIAIENGYQTAFMAPTEILAEQHYRTLVNFLKGHEVNVRLLIGGQRARLRRDILEDVRRGSAHLVVGTHALVQEGVEFARLGLITIDEQHRFGVIQRVALQQKGVKTDGGTSHPDVLVMTATPIPRTLSLTLYGDLDVSIIGELPARRQVIRTGLRTESQRKKVYQFIREEVQKGRQAYIVYPLVEESEKVDLKAATESYELLKAEIFPDLRVGLIHGRMSPDEKDDIVAHFKDQRIDILVSTTVIEVGIDIPNATVMVIEHAERFGLSQLHQLRGRVGRGSEQSYCILIAPDWLGKVLRTSTRAPRLDDELEERRNAERRLSTMVETTDGFKIAEIDLELRGPGEFFGTRQSGLPELQIANIITDGELLSTARREAFDLIARDPHLRLREHQSLRQHFDERMRETLALMQVG